jgi:hypothetical protein
MLRYVLHLLIRTGERTVGPQILARIAQLTNQARTPRNPRAEDIAPAFEAIKGHVEALYAVSEPDKNYQLSCSTQFFSEPSHGARRKTRCHVDWG